MYYPEARADVHATASKSLQCLCRTCMKDAYHHARVGRDKHIPGFDMVLTGMEVSGTRTHPIS